MRRGSICKAIGATILIVSLQIMRRLRPFFLVVQLEAALDDDVQRDGAQRAPLRQQQQRRVSKILDLIKSDHNTDQRSAFIEPHDQCIVKGKTRKQMNILDFSN